MDLLEGIAIAIVGAGVGAAIGYLVRRREHLREQRLDAYRMFFARFFEAARSGADLLSIHTQTGFPHELNRNTLTPEDIQRLTLAHGQALERATQARHEFDVAVFSVRLVGSQRSRDAVDDLRDFLDASLYRGEPWKRGYPPAGLNPAQIVPSAIQRAGPHLAALADELWRGRSLRRPGVVSRPSRAEEGTPPPEDATPHT